MNPILFMMLTMSACAIAHYSVVFLEPSKASSFKAATLGILPVIGSNLAHGAGFQPTPVLEWTIYIAITAGLARTLYGLKPLNNVTVGACYVAGSYVLAAVYSSVILGTSSL